MERTFGLLKPDCLKRGIEKEVLAVIESIGLRIIETKRVRLTEEDIDIIWVSCISMQFYHDLVEFFLSGDCLVFLAEGDNAIERLNELVGYYEPEEAEEGTIRHRFGTSAIENIIHRTSDKGTFEKETARFFND